MDGIVLRYRHHYSLLASFNIVTGVLSGTRYRSRRRPCFESYRFNGASTQQSFTITVSNVNDAPTNLKLSANK